MYIIYILYIYIIYIYILYIYCIYIYVYIYICITLLHYVVLGGSMLMLEPTECWNQQALAKECKYSN